MKRIESEGIKPEPKTERSEKQSSEEMEKLTLHIISADLFVAPAARRRGVGRALILAVASSAATASSDHGVGTGGTGGTGGSGGGGGARGLKWAMHDLNVGVRGLYDSLAVSDFREYRMRLPYIGPEGRGRRMLSDQAIVQEGDGGEQEQKEQKEQKQKEEQDEGGPSKGVGVGATGGGVEEKISLLSIS